MKPGASRGEDFERVLNVQKPWENKSSAKNFGRMIFRQNN